MSEVPLYPGSVKVMSSVDAMSNSGVKPMAMATGATCVKAIQVESVSFDCTLLQLKSVSIHGLFKLNLSGSIVIETSLSWRLAPPASRVRVWVQGLQGYLPHKKLPPHLGPP